MTGRKKKGAAAREADDLPSPLAPPETFATRLQHLEESIQELNISTGSTGGPEDPIIVEETDVRQNEANLRGRRSQRRVRFDRATHEPIISID